MRDVQPDGDVYGPGDCVDRSPALRVAKAFGRLERSVASDARPQASELFAAAHEAAHHF